MTKEPSGWRNQNRQGTGEPNTKQTPVASSGPSSSRRQPQRHQPDPQDKIQITSDHETPSSPAQAQPRHHQQQTRQLQRLQPKTPRLLKSPNHQPHLSKDSHRDVQDQDPTHSAPSQDQGATVDDAASVGSHSQTNPMPTIPVTSHTSAVDGRASVESPAIPVAPVVPLVGSSKTSRVAQDSSRTNVKIPSVSTDSPEIGMPTLPPVPALPSDVSNPLAAENLRAISHDAEALRVVNDDDDITPNSQAEEADRRQQGPAHPKALPAKRRRQDGKAPCATPVDHQESPHIRTENTQRSPRRITPNRRVGESPRVLTSGTEHVATANSQARVDGILAGVPLVRAGASVGNNLLPLDHIMTAVVQATVLIIDQRLRPVAERLDEVSEDIRMVRQRVLSHEAMVQMICKQHSEHVQDIDRVRREIKRVRTEHRLVIGETIHLKSQEWKDFIERTIDQSVNEITENSRRLLNNALNRAGIGAGIGAGGSGDNARRIIGTGGSGVDARSIVGTDAVRENSVPNSALSSERRAGHSSGFHPESHPANSNMTLPATRAEIPFVTSGVEHRGLCANDAVESRRDSANLPLQRYPFSGSSSAAPKSPSDNPLNIFKSRVYGIVARQITVWLLETQHEFFAPNAYMSNPALQPPFEPSLIEAQMDWAVRIGNECFKSAVKKFSTYGDYEDALKYLSASLGDDNVELGWFLDFPSAENVGRARRNYSAWDPPPNDVEWAVEEVLLSDISRWFRQVISSHTLSGTEGELSAAMDLCRIAASREPMNNSRVCAPVLLPSSGPIPNDAGVVDGTRGGGIAGDGHVGSGNNVATATQGGVGVPHAQRLDFGSVGYTNEALARGSGGVPGGHGGGGGASRSDAGAVLSVARPMQGVHHSDAGALADGSGAHGHVVGPGSNHGRGINSGSNGADMNTGTGAPSGSGTGYSSGAGSRSIQAGGRPNEINMGTQAAQARRSFQHPQ